MPINQPTISSRGVVRPTYVEVDLSRLTDNYRAIQQKVAPAAVMPILKANAYGHGMVEVGRHLETLDVPYLGVAFLEEGILLREAGIQTPILVLGGILDNQVPLFLDYNLTLTASSVEKLAQIDKAARAKGVRAKVHLKIDTGMERIGVHYYSAATLLEASLNCDHCLVEGIFSHFANSDAADLSSAEIQLARFQEVLDFYRQRNLMPPMRHMANSGAILQMPQSYFDMVRAGIVLYGVYPSDEVPRSIPVRPALSWKSRVVYFKVVKPGHPVSYGSTWQSDHMVRVVTVPVGYGDGYFRALSNNSEVIIRGKAYPVVGRICMDQMMVNIEWESAYNGDEVILIGESGDPGNGAISCDQLAAWAGTIPYEILTNINTRVPRIYSKNGTVDDPFVTELTPSTLSQLTADPFQASND
jgi:alanine racemase